MSAEPNSSLIRADVFAIARPLARNLRETCARLSQSTFFKAFYGNIGKTHIFQHTFLRPHVGKSVRVLGTVTC